MRSEIWESRVHEIPGPKRGNWGTRLAVSHPCGRKKPQGWGTELLWLGNGGKAGPSASLRSAQDDSLLWRAQERIGVQ
jgi:hypothetical protein